MCGGVIAAPISFRPSVASTFGCRRASGSRSMGPSGSGKSTLLNLIGGLDTPDTGDIVVDGQAVSGASRSERAELRRSRIGIVLQSLNLLGDLTVSQNVELPLRLAGRSRREARTMAGHLLHDLGLAELGSRMPDQLSGGQHRARRNHPRLRINPRSCWPTNQRAHSTVPVLRACWTCSGPPTSTARPCWSSPMISVWPAMPIAWC